MVNQNPDGQSSYRADVEQNIADSLLYLLNNGSSWGDLTVEDLATHAGIKRTLFYVYFPDKRSVLLKLGHDLIATTIEGISKGWLVRDNGPEGLRAELESWLRTRDKFKMVSKALIEGSNTDPEIRAFWEGVSRSVIDPTSERIGRAQADGNGPKGPSAAMLAFCLVLMTEKVTFEGLLDLSPEKAPMFDALFAFWRYALYGS
ncbi:MAG: TetR/AcrR family transcriptional regulator [Actinomycetes bacterium]